MSDEVDTPARVAHAARIVLRPLGNPLPLGFLALAGGTLGVGMGVLASPPPACTN